MKILISGFVTMFLLLGVQLSHAEESWDLENSCSSYYAIENQLRCGYASYVRTFALPYCQQYLDKKDSFSPQGQLILKKIRTCLQEELLNEVKSGNVLCENIRSVGIESHYKCYLESGFCDISKTDLVTVMWIARRQVFKQDVMSTFFDVLSSCQ